MTKLGLNLVPSSDSLEEGGGGGGGGETVKDEAACAMASIQLCDVPDDLLRIIVALVGREEGQGLPAVSRRFHHLFWASAPLWRHVKIGIGHSVALLSDSELTSWFADRKRLLERVAGMVHSVEIMGEDEPGIGSGKTGRSATEAQWGRVGWRAAALLASLDSPGSALRKVTVKVWGLRLSWAEAASLTRLQRLEQLWLGPSCETEDGSCQLPATAASTLGQLAATLNDLTLVVETLAATAVPALCHLTGLTELSVSSIGPLPVMNRLSELQQLKWLRMLERNSHNGGMKAPDLALMPNLWGVQLAARRIQAPARSGGGLIRGCYQEEENQCFLEMFKCQCCINRTLKLGGVCMQHSAPLFAVLDLCQVTQGHMDLLQLRHCHLDPEGLEVPAGASMERQQQALGSVHNVEIIRCNPVDEEEGIASFLDYMLPQVPNLEKLTIDHCPLESTEELADALSSSPALDSLEIKACGLESLPEGPYLEGLKYLSLMDNKLTGVPGCLGEWADSLVAINLSYNTSLELTEDAVDITIQDLQPHLIGVVMAGTSTTPEQLAYARDHAPGVDFNLTPPDASEGNFYSIYSDDDSEDEEEDDSLDYSGEYSQEYSEEEEDSSSVSQESVD